MSKRFPLATQPIEWARAVRARHSGVTRPGHGNTDMVLPRPAVSRASWTMLVSHPRQLLFAPRLHFSFGMGSAVSPPPPRPSPLTQPAPRWLTSLPVARSIVRPVTAAAKHPGVTVQPGADATFYLPGSVRRIQTGAVRESVYQVLENRHCMRRLLLTMDTASEQVTRLRQLVRRQEIALAEPRISLPARPAPPSAPADPQLVQQFPQQARGKDWESPGHGRPATPSVDQLTNHVIQQLDRRLVAYRERMGRI